ncbi:MAG: hypothetical protein IT318_15335 [Anaerolineales bacterium]|nr:hypothetical protein [Anaerolineales bacterium]
MSRRARSTPRLDELMQLSGPAQIELAIELVAHERDARTVRAALDLLRERPTPDARPALLERFAYLTADGVRRDTGTYLRAAILQTLRPIIRPEDVPLLEMAASTYEFLPPTRSEEAALLRSTALVLLNELDSRLAAFHAVRLLADAYTSRLSGEPALTAARVLAAMENTWPLYYYALHQPNAAQPVEPRSEVTSECLKGLAGLLPASLVPTLIEKHGRSQDEVVLVGLMDLLVAYEDTGYLREFMPATDKYAVYQYLATRLVATHAPRWLQLLSDQAAQETNHRKLGLLEDALALGGTNAMVTAALTSARQRRSRLATAPLTSEAQQRSARRSIPKRRPDDGAA